VGAGTRPRALAVNAATNKIYVANAGSADVTVMDGTDNITTTVGAGSGPHAVAVNPVTNKTYVTNWWGDSVTAITSVRAEPSPLTTNITPLPGHVAVQPRPTFSLSATSTFSPTTPSVRHIYYQVDTCTGPWLEASPAGATGSGQTAALLTGMHLLFAFAVDGQEATSINTGTGSSPVIGQISAYHFLMNGTETSIPLVLKRY
jgi:YVTN family beta-propeller protein